MVIKNILIATVLFSLSAVSYAAPKNKASKSERKIAQEINMNIEDQVYKLVESSEGYQVMFKSHAAVYWLYKRSRLYTQILELLKGSQKSGEMIKAKVSVDTMEITEISVSNKSH